MSAENTVYVTGCVFCDVTNTDEDQVGVWCVNCQRPLRIKWAQNPKENPPRPGWPVPPID